MAMASLLLAIALAVSSAEGQLRVLSNSDSLRGSSSSTLLDEAPMFECSTTTQRIIVVSNDMGCR